MRKFSMKAAALGVAVAMAGVTAVSVEPASAWPIKFPGPGKFPDGGWGYKGPWGFVHHGHWGWAGYGGGYDGGGDYGGCILKRYYDEYGDVVVRRVCY
jgi:hypothetical protein